MRDETKGKNLGIPIVSGDFKVEVTLDDLTKELFTAVRYEVIAYVDYQRIGEEEQGYSPFSWVFDTRDYPDGEHVITMVVCSLTGQMGSRSLKVFFQN